MLASPGEAEPFLTLSFLTPLPLLPLFVVFLSDSLSSGSNISAKAEEESFQTSIKTQRDGGLLAICCAQQGS